MIKWFSIFLFAASVVVLLAGSKNLVGLHGGSDTVKYDNFWYPSDSNLTAKILPTGDFHNDEVWPNAANEMWVGLFKNRKGEYYSDPTKIKITQIFDAIIDKADEKTGWSVTSESPDSCLILISRFKLNKAGRITAVKTPRILLPGESYKFNHNRKEYELTLHLDLKGNLMETGRFGIINYAWIASVDGKEVKEILCSIPNSDSRRVTILFAGDIDGDGLIDFLINTSSHYNLSRPTLYLSKPANKGHLLKVVAIHESVGC